ncbi:type II toxin-antitoxin system ParD family antitoxin [Algiphilus sp. W345]|uniref:Antitoxin ParD n=1 Tax=Banduia mediterranea TaxID=3075609 RepID=A0ABU2WKT4_9GAMM|nr:type II toxin-antitoxin system ParD family antitoxin [Algiphilus sp. W345]MDT0498130.1 type II toxin-antitoxin system ParD family antitoxin [Algiphilus sp. W345]
MREKLAALPYFGTLPSRDGTHARQIMGRNTSISLGSHFTDFVDERVKAGRFASASEAVRAGMRLLEQEEAKLDLLRKTLAAGESELDQGQGLDGESVMARLIG